MSASVGTTKRGGRTRRDSAAVNGARYLSATRSLSNGRDVPLRDHTERAVSDYFSSLNGHKPGHLYDMVMREVEGSLFKVVLDYAEGNQSRAAELLGINRGTLRKKLRELGLSSG